MKFFYTFLLAVIFPGILFAQPESEPNNTFETANFIDINVSRSGTIDDRTSGGVPIDPSDYYMAVFPTDGTLKINVSGTNLHSETAWLYMYGYDRRKSAGPVFAKYVGNTFSVPAGQPISDVIYVYGRAADTFYFRFQTSHVFSYSLNYTMEDVSANDAEPNNTFETSIPINRQQEKVGHIGYVKNGEDDANDYYMAVMPYDGTLRIFVNGTNNWSGTAWMYMNAYDRRKGSGQILAKYISNDFSIPKGASIFDTISLYGRAADTVYFRIVSSGAFSYSLKYDVTDTTLNDPEPNNTFEESVPISLGEEKKGHIGYVKNGAGDPYDYFRTEFPYDGTLKIYVKGTNQSGGTGWLYMDGFDRRKGSGHVFAGYISGSFNVPKGSTIYDTLYIYGRAADTFYFRLSSSEPFSYSFKYEMVDTSINDVEPNNSFEEPILISHMEVKKGHIGYLQAGTEDAYDYYVTKLPQDGTLKIMLKGKNQKGGTGWLYIDAYDKRKGSGQIMAKYVSNSSSIKADSTIYDTIYLDCRAADTIYFRINSSGAFTYDLSYEMVNTSANDAEPNDAFDLAIPVALDSLQKGHIGYVTGGVDDNDDYYRTVIPAKGTVRIIMEVTNTRGSNGWVYVYGYDKRRSSGQVLVKYVGNTSSLPANSTTIDTILLNCVSLDTFYYRITASGCFSYRFTVSHIDNDPVASFAYNQAGSLHEFTNTSKNATHYTWMSNDSVLTAKMAPPLLSYKAGLYYIKLIARNEACNFTDTAIYPLVVNGLDRITPSTGGQGNILLTAYGGGFTAGSRLRLTKGATVMLDSIHFVNNHGNIFAGLFDLHTAPTGVYDVELITPDSTYKIAGGFTLVPNIVKLRSEILGRDRIRINTDNPYSVRVYNEGNTMAGLIEVYVLFPQYMQVTILDSLVNAAGPQLSYVNLDTFPLFSNVTVQRGYPINGKLYSFWIAGIEAGGFRDLSFSVKSALGNQSIYAWVKGPWSGSEYTTAADRCWQTKVKFVTDLVNDGISVVPIADCAWNAVRAAGSFLYGLYSWASGGSSGFGASAGGVKTTAGLVKNCAGELGALAGGAPGLALEIADISTDVMVLGSDAVVNYNQIEIDCPDEPENPKKKPVDVRTSFDPNEKSGPPGFGGPRYILGSEKLMNYTIFFENVDTAALAARDVIILDTLDKTKFDVSTFKVQSFSIGEKFYAVPNAASSFSEEVAYEAGGHNVRISVNVDTATGVIRAQFKTIDTATGAEPLDPLEGFLPPNVDAPEGQGSVNYVIYLKDGLPDGTVINNKATIVFDTNDPIQTDIFSNTLDRNKPQSMVTSAYQLNDSTAVVRMTGSDPMSGVRTYKLYVSVNNGPFEFNRNINNKDTIALPVILNNRYDFYSIAVDSVGNMEIKSPVSEANITITSPLYIVLGDVSATNEGEHNRVFWFTLHEDAGDAFEVEKSQDAQTFERLAALPARGYESKYSVYDNNASYGRTYYRLKMINSDGKRIYSRIVNADKVRKGELVLKAYPNPTKDRLVLNIIGERVGKSTVQVINMAGLVVQQISLSGGTAEINMGHLSEGVYFIRYTDSNQSKVIRVVKQ